MAISKGRDEKKPKYPPQNRERGRRGWGVFRFFPLSLKRKPLQIRCFPYFSNERSVFHSPLPSLFSPSRCWKKYRPSFFILCNSCFFYLFLPKIEPTKSNSVVCFFFFGCLGGSETLTRGRATALGLTASPSGVLGFG